MRTRSTTIALLAGLALLLGAPAAAGAAATVDVSYELSDSTFTTVPADINVDTEFHTTILGSRMRITYPSDSASSMPLSQGSIVLQTLEVTLNQAWSLSPGITIFFRESGALTTASLRLRLLSPVSGTLLSGSTLAFGSGKFRISGSRHCQLSVCTYYWDVYSSVPSVFTPVTASGPFTLRGTTSPYGVAPSTIHGVSGALPIPTIVGNIPQTLLTGVDLVGREIRREAEGHDTRVIPEPGTLLLLGAGAAGLGLLGRTRRRARRG